MPQVQTTGVFMRRNRLARALAPLIFLCAATAPAFAQREDAAAAIEALRRAAGNDVRVRVTDDGVAGFVEAPRGKTMPIPGAPGADARARATAFVRGYARMFGLRSDADVEVTKVKERDQAGMEHVRMQQIVNGVPVTGSSLTVHLRGAGVVRVFSKIVPNANRVDTRPAVAATDAAGRAAAAVRKQRKTKEVTSSNARLEVLSKGLLDVRDRRPPALAWFVEVRGPGVREYIWIDALRGGVLLRFSQLTHARTRLVYNALGGDTLPGTLARAEGAAATADTDVDNAYDFSGDTYDYFLEEHGRDSFDGAGAPLISSVNYCEDVCPTRNAYWSGTQMIYGAGFAVDDVAAHELTHAVIEHSANLYYYMQSGALNESYADIFGETVDLLNGAGSDDPADRWLAGEDLPDGPLRNMMDPGAFLDPGKMSDTNFFCDSNPQDDGGGVHFNSGVPNHAYALMVDGGTFNGFTIAGIGLTKAAKIQYRALTTYLAPASSFLDNYHAVNAACADLTGQFGITTSDCAQVKSALDAVEMSATWNCAAGSAAAPPLCSAGGAFDVELHDFENVNSNAWWTDAVMGGNHWLGGVGNQGIQWPDFPGSGAYSLWGYGFDIEARSYVEQTAPVAVTAGMLMQFAHSFAFETGYDGGIVEYSVDGGATWIDAGTLITAGAAYSGQLIPENGRPAFTGDSYGYTGSQLSLAPLAGQSVVFRFTVLTDYSVGDEGWFIDDVRFYRCVAAPTNVVATAASATSVNVSWSPVAGATSYNVYRSSNGSAFTVVGSPGSSSYTDNTALANTAYLYKVRAMNGSESPDSNVDLATTVVFTDPGLSTSTPIKAAHLTEMLTAVNAVRALGGLAPVALSAPSPSIGGSVRQAHVQGLRDALHPALSVLDRALPGYTDATISAGSTGVKKVHVEELRAAVQ